ncbi:MAG: beta-propeller fold lactonase family protein [Rhodocyclaceae bacterium]|nr:beta-propeller fold lactonase family protein [Rhodocyclaceae bacterium]MCA3084625.1 beta-propeller fold lactonase family protein [Rhodocyclaceae bacterium]
MPSNRLVTTRHMLFTTLLCCATFAHAATPARLIVLNKNEATAAIVDPVSLKVLARVPTGEGPHEAAVSANGKLVVVANYGAQTPGNSLSIIDIDGAREVRRHDLGALTRPHGIQLHNGKVYFTSELTRTVARYDIATDKIDWLMGTGSSLGHMLVISADGKWLYTSNIGSDNVSAIRLDGPPIPSAIKQIAVNGRPEAIDVSPDGAELWVGHISDGTIAVVDTATHTVNESFKVGVGLNRLKFSPDGKRVVVSDPRGGESGEIIVVDVATRKIVQRIATPGAPLGIQFTPDGKRAFFSRNQAKRVEVLDMEKLAITASLETGDGPDGLAWRHAVADSK